MHDHSLKPLWHKGSGAYGCIIIIVVFPPILCNNWGMSNTANKSAGKGRIVSPATKSAKVTKSAPTKKAGTTSKQAGIPTRKTAKGHAQVVADMRAVAVKAGFKPPYTTPALDEALAKADRMTHTLTSAGLYSGTGNMPATARDGKARREWCASVKAPLVAIADILHENKEGKSVSARSENAVRIRVMTRGAYLTGARYYAIRSEAVTGSVDDQPKVYIVRV